MRIAITWFIQSFSHISKHLQLVTPKLQNLAKVTWAELRKSITEFTLSLKQMQNRDHSFSFFNVKCYVAGNMGPNPISKRFLVSKLENEYRTARKRVSVWTKHVVEMEMRFVRTETRFRYGCNQWGHVSKKCRHGAVVFGDINGNVKFLK